MSKADISIRFDRADRRYRAGETVNATVTVTVNKDVKCNGITVKYYWGTHGRGNTDTGTISTQVLYQGDLHAGQRMELPVRLVVPHDPITYHGHLLFVDHYVHGFVDIPWAIDPKVTEEILVEPGDPYPVPDSVEQPKASRPPVALILGIVVVIIAGIGFSVGGWVFGLLFFLVAGAVAAFFIARALGRQKVGEVELDVPQFVGRGMQLPVRFTLAPPQPLTVNNITATLTGMERVVSGSGTNRTTHTHQFFERQVELCGERPIPGAVPTTIDADVPIPMSAPMSFSASDNSILWSLKLHIDVPKWPDSSWNRPVIVGNWHAPQSAPMAVAAPVSAAQAVAPPRATPPPAAVAATLEQQIADVRSTSRGTHGWDAKIDALTGQSVRVEVEVQRIDWTFGSDIDERFKDGRTVVGRIAGTEYDLGVRYAKSRNDEVDDLTWGDSLHVSGVLVDWDDLYNRPIIQAD